MKVEVLLYDCYDMEKKRPVQGILHKINGDIVITVGILTETLKTWKMNGWIFDFVDEQMPYCIHNCEECITPIC